MLCFLPYYDYYNSWNLHYVTCSSTTAGPVSHSNCFCLVPSWLEVGQAVQVHLTFLRVSGGSCILDGGGFQDDKMLGRLWGLTEGLLHPEWLTDDRQMVLCQQRVEQPARTLCPFAGWRGQLWEPRLPPFFLFPVVLPVCFLYPACDFFLKNLISWSRRVCREIYNGIIALMRPAPFPPIIVGCSATFSRVFRGKPETIFGGEGGSGLRGVRRNLVNLEVGWWVRNTHFLLTRHWVKHFTNISSKKNLTESLITESQTIFISFKVCLTDTFHPSIKSMWFVPPFPHIPCAPSFYTCSAGGIFRIKPHSFPFI